MTIKPFLKAIAAMAVSGMMFNASANSISFDMGEYMAQDGTVTVTINYDFSDFAMFGGGFDVLYDSSVIEFVSYEQAPLPADAQAPASPVGALAAPGAYEGAGIGTFDFFTGMTSTGVIGTFTFTQIDLAGGGDAGCGFTLCLTPNAVNPLVSLAGADVSLDILGGGSNVTAVPVPAAVWFLLSGLGALLGFGRKSA